MMYRPGSTEAGMVQEAEPELGTRSAMTDSRAPPWKSRILTSSSMAPDFVHVTACVSPIRHVTPDPGDVTAMV
jgi:hypothetical protein